MTYHVTFHASILCIARGYGVLGCSIITQIILSGKATHLGESLPKKSSAEKIGELNVKILGGRH